MTHYFIMEEKMNSIELIHYKKKVIIIIIIIIIFLIISISFLLEELKVLEESYKNSNYLTRAKNMEHFLPFVFKSLTNEKRKFLYKQYFILLLASILSFSVFFGFDSVNSVFPYLKQGNNVFIFLLFLNSFIRTTNVLIYIYF